MINSVIALNDYVETHLRGIEHGFIDEALKEWDNFGGSGVSFQLFIEYYLRQKWAEWVIECQRN
jgi:hypothetical protein